MIATTERPPKRHRIVLRPGSPYRDRTRAFTLLELIVVIIILGILAALAIPTFIKVITKSKYATVAQSLLKS